MRISSSLTFILGLILFGISFYLATLLSDNLTQIWQYLTTWWLAFNILFWFAIYFTGITFTDRLSESANNTWKEDIGADNPLSGCAFILLFYRKMFVILTDKKESRNREAKGNLVNTMRRTIRATLYCAGWIALVYLLIEGFYSIKSS